MLKILSALLLALSCWAAGNAQPLEPHRDLRENVAREFEGTYRFNYLFAENGVIYLDESSHFQALDFDRTEGESAPRITFFNQTSKGEKRAHYSYAFHQEENKLTLRELDGNGNFRFDCVGTYQPEKRLLECDAPRAPKPARDSDSPATRKSGLFKRPTAWPAYEWLSRHNIFRFYEWGFINLQENLKLDTNGKIIARESGVITAVKLKPQGSPRQQETKTCLEIPSLLSRPPLKVARGDKGAVIGCLTEAALPLFFELRRRGESTMRRPSIHAVRFHVSRELRPRTSAGVKFDHLRKFRVLGNHETSRSFIFFAISRAC